MIGYGRGCIALYTLASTSISYIFFFQAEDGIRDKLVTGVQTCALPISFDVTPEGIKTTPTIAVPGAHRRRNVIMLVATGVIISAAAGFFLLPRAIARKLDKSIAVLPFEDRKSVV